LRDHMRDELFNDCLVIYMESDIFDNGKTKKYLTTHLKYEVTHISINIVIYQY